MARRSDNRPRMAHEKPLTPGNGPPERKNGIDWRRVGLWLVVVALAVDALAVMSYVSDKKFFEALADEIVSYQNLSDRQVLEKFVEFAYHDLERPGYDDLPSTWVKLYYKLNPFHPSARDVIEYGCDYRGGCGSSSRVVMALLDAHKIPSRSLILQDSLDHRIHAVVNANIDRRWAVADPLYGIVFKHADGTPATAEELREDRALFMRNARANTAYPYEVFDYDNYALMNWKKIPVVLPAIHWVLEHTIGEERTASISRPGIWMYPLPAFASVFTFFALALALVAHLVRR